MKKSKNKTIGVNPFHLPFRKFHIHLAGSNHPAAAPKKAEDKPSHIITLLQPSPKDRSKDKLYFNNMLIHRKNWKWQHGNTNLIWTQGQGKDHLGGSIHITPNHTEGYGMVNVAGVENTSNILVVQEMTFSFNASAPNASNMAVSYDVTHQQFDIDAESPNLDNWTNPSNFKNANLSQVTLKTINMPTVDGDNILQYVFQFCDTRNKVCWQPWIPLGSSAMDVPAGYTPLDPDATPTTSPNYFTSYLPESNIVLNPTGEIQRLTFDFYGDSIPQPTGTISPPLFLPYKMILDVTLVDSSTATANGMMLLTTPDNTSPEYFCLQGSGTFPVPYTPQNSPDAPGTLNYLDLLRSSDVYQNGKNVPSDNTKKDFSDLLKYYVYESQFGPGGNSTAPSGTPLVLPDLTQPEISQSIQSIGSKNDNFYNNLVEPMLVAILPSTDVPNTINSRRQLNVPRAQQLLTNGISSNNAFCDQINALYQYEYDQFCGGKLSSYCKDQQHNGLNTPQNPKATNKYPNLMKGTLCKQWKQNIINNYKPCLTPSEWQTVAVGVGKPNTPTYIPPYPTTYSDPSNNQYNLDPSTIEKQAVPDKLTVLKTKLSFVNQAIYFAVENDTYWALKVFMYLVSPTYQNYLSHNLTNGGNDSEMLYQQIKNYISLLNLLTSNDNTSLSPSEVTTFSQWFMETVASNSVFGMAEIADYSRMDVEQRDLAIAIINNSLDAIFSSADTKLAQEISQGWSQFTSDQKEEKINQLLNDFGAIARNFGNKGIQTRISQIFDEYESKAVSVLGTLTKGGIKVIANLGSLAITTTSIFSIYNKLSTTKFSKMTGEQKAAIIMRSTDMALNALHFVVSGGIRSYEAFQFVKNSVGADTKLWGKLKLFANEDLRNDLVGESSNAFVRWLGDGKPSKGNARGTEIEKEVNATEEDTSALEDADMIEFFKGESPLGRDGVTIIFGENMSEFMATRWGTVMGVANTVFSVYQMVKDIENMHSVEGGLQVIDDSLFVLSSIFDTIGAAAGWIAGKEAGVAAGVIAEEAEDGFFAATADICGFLGPAAAIGGVLLDIGLLLYDIFKPKTDPFAKFTQNYANNFTYYQQYQYNSTTKKWDAINPITIDFYMESGFAIENFCYNTQTGSVIEGTSFQNGSDYLQLTDSKVQATTTQSNDYDTVFALQPKFDGSVQILTKDPATDTNMILRIDESGDLTAVPYTASNNGGTSYDQTYQQWKTKVVSGQASYNSGSDIFPSSYSSTPVFTLQNVKTSQYLILKNDTISLSSTSDSGNWSISNPSLRPNGIEYNQSGFGVLGFGGPISSYSPKILQGRTSSELKFSHVLQSNQDPLPSSWADILDMDTWNATGVIGLKNSTESIGDNVTMQQVSVTASDNNGTSTPVDIVLQSSVNKNRPIVSYGSSNVIYLDLSQPTNSFSPTNTGGTTGMKYERYTENGANAWPSWLSLDPTKGIIKQTQKVPKDFIPMDLFLTAQNPYGIQYIQVTFDFQPSYGSTYGINNLLNIADSKAVQTFSPSPAITGYNWSIKVYNNSGQATLDLPSFITMNTTTGEITVSATAQSSGLDSMNLQKCLVTISKGTQSTSFVVQLQSNTNAYNNVGMNAKHDRPLSLTPGSTSQEQFKLEVYNSNNAIVQVQSIPKGFKSGSITGNSNVLTVNAVPSDFQNGSTSILVMDPTYGYYPSTIPLAASNS